MDTITLTGIEVYAYGGVSDEERRIGQRYRLDIDLELDLRAAGASDAIGDTVHYGEVHDVAVGTLRERPFNLLEHAAARIADRLLRDFAVQRVRVRLSKLLPPVDGILAAAAVEIARARDGLG